MKKDVRKTGRYEKQILTILLLVMLVIVLTVILGIVVASGHNKKEENYIEFEDDWQAENGETADLEEIEKYGTVYKAVPELERDEVLSFRVKSTNICVYIDDECVYETDVYAAYLFGKTPGSYFVNIPLHREYSGKTISIISDTPYADGSGKINRMYLGDGIELVLNNVNQKFTGFLICVVISFLGLFLICMFIPVKRLELAQNEMLYLGLFAFNIGIYMGTDCGTLGVLIGNEALLHMIAEISMMVLAVPLMLYLNCKYESKRHRGAWIISIYSTCVFVFCYISHWLDFMDYHQLLVLTHISYIMLIVYYTYRMIQSVIKGRTGQSHHVAGLVCIFSGVILDIVTFQFGISNDSSMFTRLGVLLFLILEGIQIIEQMLAEYQEGVKAQLLSRLAYHDGLTDMLNRTSFIEDKEKMERENSCGLVAVFDANNLKKINDYYGHVKGDEMIITVANEIQNVFGDMGKCYRIGGDEFVVLTGKECTREALEAGCGQMHENLRIKSAGNPYVISVAVGYAAWDKKKYKNLQECFDEADARMYEAKKQMKAQAQMESIQEKPGGDVL